MKTGGNDVNCYELMRNMGVTYSGIARACGVSEATVRRWMSQKGIPERYAPCLEMLAVEKKNPVRFVSGDGDAGLRVEMSIEHHSKLSRMALEAGCSLEELIERHLNSFL